MGTLSGKRLVVFGCGYIGGEVARQAIARGLQVAALTRNAETAAVLRSNGVTVVLADLATDAWHKDIAGGADLVLNAVSSGGGGVEGYRRSYVAGMQSVLRWAGAREPMGTFVYTSSTSVYPQDGGAYVDESVATGGGGELSQVLIEAEQLLTAFASTTAAALAPGVSANRPFNRAFILRLAGIYGPGRRHLLDQVRAGSVSGKPETHLNLAHRDDIAAAIWSALAAPPGVEGGIFNVADDGAERKVTIVNWLAQELGLPPPQFTGAPVAGRKSVTPDRVIANARIKQVLGWQPRFPTFREGYKNMLALRAD